MENKNEQIKAYKGFDKDLKCRRFQYKIGKTYHHDGPVELCQNGFHAIHGNANPLSIFDYYPPSESRYCEVLIGGETKKNEEKIVGSDITIGKEIGVEGIIKAYEEWVQRQLIDDSEHKISKRSLVSDIRNFSSASNTGDCSLANNTGGCSSASNTGDCSLASNTGGYSVASNTGNRSIAINAGNCSLACNVGFNSSAEVMGKGSVAMATGMGGKARGSLGCAIVVVERGGWNGETHPLIGICSAIVDGVKIKADTWYTAKNGQLVEVNEVEE